MYYKNFNTYIEVYASFFKDEYCDYFKHEINKWISNLLTYFEENFHLEVATNSKIATFYAYDIKDKQQIDFSQLWRPGLTYSINISGSGFIHHGIYNNQLYPPKNILENVVRNITFKYIEQVENKPPELYYFGPELNFPTTINETNLDTEFWQYGSKDYNLMSHCWDFSFYCDESSFLDFNQVFNQLKKINPLKNFELNSYQDEGYIEAHGPFLLHKPYKKQYLYLIDKLNKIIINADIFDIENLEIFFKAIDPKIFYIESWIFDEMKGLIIPKSILV